MTITTENIIKIFTKCFLFFFLSAQNFKKKKQKIQQCYLGFVN